MKEIFNLSHFALAFIFSLLIRLILSAFKSAELLRYKLGKGRFVLFKESFWSSANNELVDDYWLPFWLGFLELVIYTYFIARKWEFIAFWIGV